MDIIFGYGWRWVDRVRIGRVMGFGSQVGYLSRNIKFRAIWCSLSWSSLNDAKSVGIFTFHRPRNCRIGRKDRRLKRQMTARVLNACLLKAYLFQGQILQLVSKSFQVTVNLN
jgi:hypothetical protein